MEDVCLVELGQGLFARHLLEGTSALSRADVDRADDGWWEHLAAELLAAVEDPCPLPLAADIVSEQAAHDVLASLLAEEMALQLFSSADTLCCPVPRVLF